MRGVLEAALCVCVCKLMSGALLLPFVATHSVTAVGLCCCCLLLFTDLAVTLFLSSIWLIEFWVTLFPVSSDVIALHFLLFLCQVYLVVLLLTPPLMAVEILMKLLRTQDGRTKGRHESTESLSTIISILGCLLTWLVSAIYCSHEWTLERMFVEECLNKGGCIVSCLPDDDELSWVVPALTLVLSLMGLIGMKESSGNLKMEDKEGDVVLWRTHMSLSPESKGSARSGSVRTICPGNEAPPAHQTGSTNNYILKQKPAFAGSKAALLPKVRFQRCVFKRRERESPCPFPGLLCVILLCVFPTVVSCNVLLIFNLENMVVLGLRLLSLSVNRVPDL